MKRTVIAALLLAVGLSAQAQMVGATNDQQTSRVSSNNSLLRQTGSYIRISAGYPDIGTLAYNYQITSWLMAGVGGGFGFVNVVEISNWYNSYGIVGWHTWTRTKSSPVMPVFAELEFSTPKYRWSLFANLKFGYYLFNGYPDYYTEETDGFGNTIRYDQRWSNEILGSASIGVGFKNLRLGFGYSSQDILYCFFAYSLPLKVIGLL